MNEATEKPFSQQVMDEVEKIKPMLAGKPPELQSAILADLTSIWLCGIQVIEGSDLDVKEVRNWALETFLELVINLTESGVNDPIRQANWRKRN